MTFVEVEQGDSLKTGDTDPDLIVQLRKDNGNPRDLTGADVSLYVEESGGADSLHIDDDTDGNVTIEEAAQGRVSYSYQSSDTDSAATYVAEFEVDDAGDISTYPNSGNFTIRVQEGLN